MRTTCSRECLLLLHCTFSVFFMPMIMNLLLFRDDEGELDAPPAKKPKTGSAKSVNSGPEALKEKTENIECARTRSCRPECLDEDVGEEPDCRNFGCCNHAFCCCCCSACKGACKFFSICFYLFFGLLQVLFSSQVVPRANACLRAVKGWLSRIMIFICSSFDCFAADPFHRSKGL